MCFLAYYPTCGSSSNWFLVGLGMFGWLGLGSHRWFAPCWEWPMLLMGTCKSERNRKEIWLMWWSQADDFTFTLSLLGTEYPRTQRKDGLCFLCVPSALGFPLCHQWFLPKCGDWGMNTWLAAYSFHFPNYQCPQQDFSTQGPLALKPARNTLRQVFGVTEVVQLVGACHKDMGQLKGAFPWLNQRPCG